MNILNPEDNDIYKGHNNKNNILSINSKHDYEEGVIDDIIDELNIYNK